MEVTESFENYGLNPAEQCSIKVSLIDVKLNENFTTTKFWGKIFGIECDYLIIEATTVTHQIQHKYFFSIDGGLTFAQLPIVEPWMESKCMKIASYFTGMTSFIYKDKKSKSENALNDDEENEQINEEKEENEENKNENTDDEPPKIEYKLTELDRLAWTISKINDECHIVPKNCVILTSSKNMFLNKNFSGLSRNDANKLDSYLHFRTPKDPYAISKYRKSVAMNDSDFLDPIINDLPNGCWKLWNKKCGLQISIKNLLWHGFEFKYNVCDSHFVQAYFGYGIRRNDLVFMI